VFDKFIEKKINKLKIFFRKHLSSGSVVVW